MQTRAISRKALLTAIAAVPMFSASTFAIDVIKADNVDNLDLTTSWVGGVAPTSADVAVWDATVLGANTVLLGTDQSYQGIRIASPGGLVTIGAGNNLTLGTSGIDMSAATQNLTIGSGLILAGAQTWNVGGAQILTISGAGSGTGGLTKSGTGTVVLTGNQTWTGNTTVSAGTLDIGGGTASGSVVGDILNNGTVVFNRSNDGIFPGVVSGTGNVVKLGAGTRTLTATNTYSGGTTITAGTLKIGDFSNTGSIPLNNVVLNGGTLEFNRLDTTTLSATGITGTGTVAERGGTLTLDFSAGGAPASDIIANTASLALRSNGVFNMIGAAGGTNTQTFVSTSIGGNNLTTISAQNGAGGTATLNLGNILGGQSNIATQAPGFGAMVRFVGPATQDAAGAPVAATGTITVGTAAVTATVLGAQSGQQNVGSAGSGYGTVGLYDYASLSGATVVGLSQNGGYTSATGAITPAVVNYDLTGNTAFPSGSRVSNTIRWNTPAATTLTLNNTLYQNAAFLITPNMGANDANVVTGTAGATFQIHRTTNPNGGQAANIWQNNTLGFFNFNTVITDGRDGTNDPDWIVKGGAGTFVYGATNTFTGGTIINEGAVVVSTDANLGATAAAVRINGGTLIGGGTVANAAVTTTLASHPTSIYGAATISASTGNKLIHNGVISDNTGAQTLHVGSGLIAGTGAGTAHTTDVFGNGIVQFGGANTYTKGTSVDAGFLLATNTTGSATGTGNVTVNSGATFGGTGAITGAATALSGGHINSGIPGTLSGIGTVTTGGMTFNSGSILDLDMSPGGNDMVNSTNGLTVNATTGFNLFTAGTASPFTINGTYNIFNVTAGTIPSAISLNSNFSILNGVGGGSYTWGVSGTTVQLTIGGLTTIATWANALPGTWGSGPNWTSNPSIPDSVGSAAVMGSTLTTSGQITLDGSRTIGTITFNNNVASYDIAPGSGGTLNVDGGAGAASIVNSSAAGGNHTISAPMNLISTTVTVGVANLANTLTFSGNISGNNLVIDGGFGTVVLTGTNTYGTTNVSSNDILMVGNGGTTGTLGSGAVTVGGTLRINRSDAYTISNNLTGTGTFVQQGAGTTTLTGTNSGTWGTTVSAGALVLGTGSNIGTGALAVNSGLLDLNGNSVSATTLTGAAGNIDNVSAGGAVTLTLSDTPNGTFAGNLKNTTGTLAVVKNGTGVLTLTGNNTMTGGFTVNNGAVLLGSSTALPVGSTITNRVTGAGVQVINSSDVGGTIIFDPAATTTNGLFDVTGGVSGTPNDATLSGSITTPTTLAANNSNMRLSAGNDLFNSMTVTGTGSINLPDATNTTYNGLVVFERGHWTFKDNSVLNTRPATWFGRSAGASLTFDFKDNAVANITGGLTLAAGGAATTSVVFTMQDNVVISLGNPNATTLNGVTGPVNGGLFLNGGATSTVANLNGGTLWTNSIGTTNATTLNLNGTLIKAEDINAAFMPLNANLNAAVGLGGAKFDTTGNANYGGAGVIIQIDQPLVSGVAGDGGLTKSGTGTLILTSTNTYAGPTTVTGGMLQTQTNGIQNGAPLVASTGGVFDVAINGTASAVTRVSDVTTGLTGKVDLHDNDMVIEYGVNPTSYTSIVNQVKSGLALLGGTDGDANSIGDVGIGSTEVDLQTVAGTILAVVDDGDPNIGGGITALSGYTIPNPTQSVLVKYTWFGDANLDGIVDGSDYALTDTGFTSGGLLGGWVFGDYDYSGTVDGGDYALQDTGFIAQTGALPEPTTLGLLGLGAVGMLRRRRRA